MDLFSNNIEDVINTLKIGVDVNFQSDMSQNTALYHHARHGNVKIVKLLLEHGADPNIGNRFNNIPIRNAIANGNIDIIKLLLPVSNLNNVNIYGNNIIFTAVGQYNIEVLKLLIQYNVNINIRNNSGQNPLHHACLIAAPVSLIKLLAKYIDVNSVDNNGCTPLHYCYQYDCVKELIKSGANINKKDLAGKTPLMYTINRYNTNIMKLLIDNGAKITTKDSNGTAPKDKINVNKYIWIPMYLYFIGRIRKIIALEIINKFMLKKWILRPNSKYINRIVKNWT
jgi:ankyrin repeat protein